MKDILRQQINYYRARAGEYDEWFYRQGRYDRGEALNRKWFDQVTVLMQALYKLGPVNTALELACGTGIWTEQLLKISRQITAIDASPEVIAINRRRLQATNVHYRQEDLFTWEPDRTYDLVFFSFWLSHVPPEHVGEFLGKVHRALRTNGQLFIVDSLFEPTSTATDHHLATDQNTYITRRLNDGREWTIVKVFYKPRQLREQLAQAGFDAIVEQTDDYFLYAKGKQK